MLELGDYGGRYVPETLVPALDELEREPGVKDHDKVRAWVAAARS